MGYLVPGEMFENMLHLMCFSVYFEGIDINIMIAAARGPVPSDFFWEKMQFGAF